MPYLPLLTKLVSTSEESSWKNRNSVNGVSVKMILNVFKTKDSTCSRVLLLKEKRKLKKSMLKELKKSDSRRLKTKKEL